ncbi:MAG TPA: DUF6328 family protein [Verrucomicrobiae bacterium]|jgi:hypothetical protein
MAELRDKIKWALDEARMLILGCEVLLGFELRSFFEKRFDELPSHAQLLKFTSLWLLLIALLLLLLPAVYHRIVEQGEDTARQHRFTTAVMDFALLPFALVLAADVYIAVREVTAPAGAMACSVGIGLFTLFFWYGLQWIVRAKRKGGKNMKQDERSGRTPLKDKIEHVLTECRVALPGLQALLGFQLATTLMESFSRLPASSQRIHLASLGFIAVGMVLLMTPAAYHRIVEEGEATEQFHRFASRMLLAALVALALGVSGDVFVVARKLLESVSLAAALAAGCALLFLGTWFGVTGYLRSSGNGRTFKEAKAAA